MCIYYTNPPFIFKHDKKGLRGLKHHKYCIFRGYLKKLPVVTNHIKGLR